MEGPVRVGVAGTGFGALAHVPAFQGVDGASVEAICSRRLERARSAAERLGIPRCFDDPTEMLRDADLDLVCVVTPPATHRAVSQAALEAGAHVLCEKPFTLDVAEAEDLVVAARASGRLAFVNFEFRVLPARRELTRLVRSGELGEIRQVNVLAMVAGARFPVLNNYGWWHERAAGGGWLGAMGSHYVDALCEWLGDATEVACHLETSCTGIPDEAGLLREVSVDDGFAARLRFCGGALATLTSGSRALHAPSQRIEVYGSAGSAIVEDDAKLLVATGDEPLREVALPSLPAAAHPSLAPMAVWAEEVVGAVRENRQIAPNFADGLRCQRLLDAMRASHAAGGRTIPVECR